MTISIANAKIFKLNWCVGKMRSALALLGLFILIWLSYSNSLDAPWFFDDYGRIVGNSSINITKLDFKSLKGSLFSGSHHRLYRPIPNLTLALNYYFSGYELADYHLVNIFVHFLTSSFLFFFILYTLNTQKFRKEYSSFSFTLAFLATALWAVNPIHTSAVTYVTQRMASMAGMFYILGMLFYLIARTTELRGRMVLSYALCSVSVLLAVGSKENAILLPFSIMLYEIIILQSNVRKIIKEHKFLFLMLGSLVLIGFGLLYVQVGGVDRLVGGYVFRPFTLEQRLLTEPRILVFYLSLLYYPIFDRFSAFHSVEHSTSLFSPVTTIGSIILIFTLLFIALRFRRKWPIFSFSILFFFLNHVIESTIIPLELLFEHRNYIPSMFMFLPLAVIMKKSSDFFQSGKCLIKWMVVGFALVYLAFFIDSSFMRNSLWSNREALFLDVLKKYPESFRAHQELGSIYGARGNYELAREHLESALSSNIINRSSERYLAHYNIGIAYTRLQEYQLAKENFNKVIKYMEGSKRNIGILSLSEAYIRLAMVYIVEKDFKKAAEILLKADTLKPNDPIIYYNLGISYIEMQQAQFAIERLRKIGLAPIEYLININLGLGVAHKALGQFNMAEKCFRKVLDQDSNKLDYFFHLFEVLLMEGKSDLAFHEMSALFADRKFSKLQVQDFIYQIRSLDEGWMRLDSELLEPLVLRWLAERD